MGVSSFNKSLNFFKTFINPNMATVPVIELNDRKPEFIKKDILAPLDRATPESQGVDSKIICDFLSEISKDKTLNMHNILILKNGKIISETEFDNSDLSVWKMSFSACKSIVALAVGMLVDDGLLDINTPISEFFADSIGAVSKIKLREITVRTLLTMSTGASFNELLCMTSQNWERSFLKGNFSTKPGEEFNYNSLNTYMLSVIVAKVSSLSLTEFLKLRLFEPLQIDNYYFENGPTGFELGGWGFYIRPEDFAKIGQLILNKGVWNSQRIISEDWINYATIKQISTPSFCGGFDYGYHIWVGRDTETFLFNGMFGQNILGFKESGILIVSNAGNSELFQQSNYFKIVNNYFGRKFANNLPKNQKAVRKMKKLSVSFSQKCKSTSIIDIIIKNHRQKKFIKNREIIDKEFIGVSENSASVGLLPKILQVIQNNYSSGFKSIRFSKINNKLLLVYSENNAVFNIPVAVDKYEYSQIDIYGEKYLISSSLSIEKDEESNQVLIVKIDFIETASTRKIKIYFKDGKIVLKQFENPGIDFLKYSLPMLKGTSIKSTILGTFIKKIDDDFLSYKFSKIFEPTIELILV